MAFYIILRGPLGIGKSTIAKKLSKILKAEYFSIDKILEKHNLDKIDEKQGRIPASNFIKADNLILPKINNLLKKGKIVILDGCFYHKEQIKHIENNIHARGYVFNLKAPLKTCITRDSRRKNYYGKEAAEAVHKLVSKFDYGTNINADNKYEEQVTNEILSKINMTKAIFFDFDLTLVNTMPGAIATYRALCRASDTRPTKKGFDEYIGNRLSADIDKFSKQYRNRKELLKIYNRVFSKEISKMKLYNKTIFSYLKKRKIKIVIISGNSKPIISKIAKRNNLHPYLIVADEDMRKGEQKHQAILKTLKKLKLKKDEIFYVGDHIHDIKEARKAGVRVISVTTGVYSRKELMRHKPDFVISNLNQIKSII